MFSIKFGRDSRKAVEPTATDLALLCFFLFLLFFDGIYVAMGLGVLKEKNLISSNTILFCSILAFVTGPFCLWFWILLNREKLQAKLMLFHAVFVTLLLLVPLNINFDGRKYDRSGQRILRIMFSFPIIFYDLSFVLFLLEDRKRKWPEVNDTYHSVMFDEEQRHKRLKRKQVARHEEKRNRKARERSQKVIKQFRMADERRVRRKEKNAGVAWVDSLRSVGIFEVK